MPAEATWDVWQCEPGEEGGEGIPLQVLNFTFLEGPIQPFGLLTPAVPRPSPWLHGKPN